jgi:hypothetical protein
MAILELQDRIISNIAAGKWCAGIFLDLSKAFDTLDHKILLLKLNYLGIRGICLSWFQNYLSERSQFVEIRKSQSSSQKISCGVPQGSILGPLLFLVYINDIIDHIQNSNAILFADDTTILLTDHNFENLEMNMNSNLSIIYKWLCVNKLSLNIKKTNYVIFHSNLRKLPHKPLVNIDGREINMVDNIKFLGVHIDKNMTWKSHCNVIINKCLKILFVLSRLKFFLPVWILSTIYHSLFLPYISYAITAWGNISIKESKRLFQIQKRAIRTITKSKFNCHTDPLFQKMKILKINDLFHVNCCKLYHKAKNGNLEKLYLIEKLSPNNTIHHYNTRQAHDIHQVNINKSLEKQLLNFKISSCWNNLPVSLKNKRSSIYAFTKALKKHFISQYITICNIENTFVRMSIICKHWLK